MPCLEQLLTINRERILTMSHTNHIPPILKHTPGPWRIHRLAHGWRSVIALTPGRKWVTVIDWTTLETTRMEIAAWEMLQPLEAAGLNRRKVRATMRRRLKYMTATRAIKRAMTLLRNTAA
jgi:hypothetical protein